MTRLPSVMDYTVQETHIKGEYKDYLHRPLFDVNTRLYGSSRLYRGIVDDAVDYLSSIFMRKFKDYPKIKGVSGANLGVPFNIIAVKRKSGRILEMVNPEVLKQLGKVREVESNCGSLVLDDPIKVKRRTKIKVSYCEIVGNGNNRKLVHRTKWFKNFEACTIQHEVDHNNGITILDRQVANEYLT